jgi:hypothetical protein
MRAMIRSIKSSFNSSSKVIDLNKKLPGIYPESFYDMISDVGFSIA